MSEESSIPNPLDLTRRQFEAVNRRDRDAVMSFCPPNSVYDTSHIGLGVYEGAVAIRGFLEGWWSTFEELVFEPEEVLDVGNGLVFLIVRQDARPAGSTSYVRTREAHIVEWVDGMTIRVTTYDDIDEAGAAAERLAEERE